MWSETVRHPTPGLLLRWLVFAGWPMHVVFTPCALLTLTIAKMSGQEMVATATGWLALHYFLGLWTSFAIHELSHEIVLARASGVTAITLERSMLRLSIVPHGSIRGRTASGAALIGPGSCILIGLLLWVAFPQSHLHLWYIAHAAFLIPLFGDGHVILTTVRSGKSTLSLPTSPDRKATLTNRAP